MEWDGGDEHLTVDVAGWSALWWLQPSLLSSAGAWQSCGCTCPAKSLVLSICSHPLLCQVSQIGAIAEQEALH